MTYQILFFAWYGFINNSDIEGSCLNRGKLHLKGTSMLDRNMGNFLNSISARNDKVRDIAVVDTETNLVNNLSDISETSSKQS